MMDKYIERHTPKDHAGWVVLLAITAIIVAMIIASAMNHPRVPDSVVRLVQERTR